MTPEEKTDIIERFENDALHVVESNEWFQEHKSQHRSVVVEYASRYFLINEQRSGSYYTDWHYETPTVEEVTQRIALVEKTFWDPVVN